MVNYTDPYYWSKDLMRTQSQQKALGQTQGLSPQALTGVVAANYQAQSQEEDSQRKYDLAVRQQNLQESATKRQLDLKERESNQQAVSSAVSAPIQGLMTYNLGKQAGLWGATTPETLSATGTETALGTATTLQTPSLATGSLYATGATGAGLAATEALPTLASYGVEGALSTPISTALPTTYTSLGIATDVTAGTGMWSAIGSGISTAGEAVAGAATAAWEWLADIVVGVAAWVLCSELVRQGLLEKEIVDQEWEYIKPRLTTEVYWGYRLLADPLVRIMQRSKLFTKCIAPFIRAFAYEMASRVNPNIKGSRLGSFILFVGCPICKAVYIVKYRRKSWLKHLTSRVA